MIERLTTADIPIQQRSTYNEGAKVNPAKAIENPDHTKQYDQKQSPNEHTNKKEKVEEIINGLNDFLRPSHTSLKFKLHEKLHEYYVTIVDDNTNEVVKEIPAKKLLDTYAAMAEHLGLLVDKKI